MNSDNINVLLCLSEKWLESISKEEWIEIQKKYGYYGHDQSINEDELIKIYKSETNR